MTRIGLGKLSRLEPPEPPNRYERRKPASCCMSTSRSSPHPRQVVQLGEASEGRLVAEGAVSSAVIVGPEAAVECGGAFGA